MGPPPHVACSSSVGWVFHGPRLVPGTTETAQLQLQESDNPTLIGGHSKIPNRVGKYPNIEVAFYSTSSWLIQYWHDELPFWVIHLLSTSYMPLHLRKVAIVDPKIQFTLVRPDFGGPVSSSPQATMQSVSKLPDDTVLVRTALKKDETRHNQKVARHP